MPIARFQMPDGRIARFEVPAGLTPEQAESLIEQEVFGTPQAKPTERTLAEAATDIYAGGKAGLGALLQFPSQAVGLVTGEMEKPGEETGLAKAGIEMQKEAEAMKSPGLKAREAARAGKISEAEKRGQVDAFFTAFSETVSDPALLTNFLAEQAPQLIPALGVARLIKPIAGTQAAIRGAVGTGATQQAADVGADTYREVYETLVKKGMSETEAAGQALGLARASGVGAFGISLIAQRLPGARAIEEAFAGKEGQLGRILGGVRGATGEAVSEMAEETPAKALQNYLLQQGLPVFDLQAAAPEISLTRGLGEVAAMAALGGAGLGGAAGLLQRQQPKEPTPVEENQIPLLLEGKGAFVPVALPDGSVAMTREDLARYEEEQFRKKYEPQEVEKEQSLLGYEQFPFTPVVLPDGSVITSREELARYEEEQFSKKYAPQPADRRGEFEQPTVEEAERPAMTYGEATQEVEFLKQQPKSPEVQARIQELQGLKMDMIMDGIRRAREPVRPELVQLRKQMESGALPEDEITESINQALADFRRATIKLETAKPPKSEVDLEIKDLTKEANDLYKQMRALRGSAVDKSGDLKTILRGRLGPDDVYDISPEKSVAYLAAKEGKRFEILSDLVEDGILDKWLPPAMRHDSGTFDAQKSTEYVKDMLRSEQAQDPRSKIFEYETQSQINDLAEQLLQIDQRISELKSPDIVQEAVGELPVEERRAEAAKLAPEEGFVGVEKPLPEPVEEEEYFPDQDLLKEEGRGRATERAKFVINKDPEHARIEKELTGKTLLQVSQWAVDNAPNQFAKAIAQKVSNRLKGMANRGIKLDFEVTSGERRPLKMSNARGITEYDFGKPGQPQMTSIKITLNGDAVVDNQRGYPPGTRYITVLHELLHAATVGQINVLKGDDPIVKELRDLFNKVVTHFNTEVRAGRLTPFMERMYAGEINPLTGPDELVAWGIADRDMQEFLSEIKVGEQTIMDKLVELIRKILNVTKPYLTALDQLVKTTESILDEDVNKVGDKIIAKQYSFGVSPGDTPAQGTLFEQAGKPSKIEGIKQKAKEAAKKASGQREMGEAFKDVKEDLQDLIKKNFYAEQKTIVDRIDNMRDGFWKKMAQGVADQYRSIKDYTMEGYMLARLSKTVDGALQGLLFSGQVALTDGALDIKKNTKGLMEALKPVGTEVDRYLVWVAANRDAQLRAAGKQGSMDPGIVERRNELSKGDLNGKPRLEVYKQVQKDMAALNKSVLDIALKQGIIDKIAYKRFSEDIWYVPFYREMESGDIQGASTAAGLSGQYFSKELKGGEKPIGDLLENTLLNWSHILSASMKNKAANVTIDETMKVAPDAVFPVLKANLEWRDGKVYSALSGNMVGDGSLKPEYTTRGKGVKQVVKLMRDGKPIYFQVADPLLLESIMSIGYLGPKSKFLDVARDFKNLLQFGVTLAPGFKVRNLIRDSAAAAAVADLSLNLPMNVLEGLRATDEKNPDHISALAGGAIFNFGSAYEGDQAKMVKRLIKQGVNPNNILDTEEKIKKGLALAWKKYQDWGNKSEAANRMALYKQLKAKGMSHLEASFYARDLLDFSMQGAWPAFRLVTQVVPFLNARVQGLYKLGRDGIIPTSRVIYNTVTGKPIEDSDAKRAQQFSIVSGAVVLASVMLYMAFKDDDEFKKREQWDRDNFWWIKLPGMDSALRVPKPFEIGAFGTLAERLVEQMADKGAEGRVFEQSLKRMLTDTFAINPMPQVFKPLVDLYANKDSFTGAPIETAGMERLSKAERIASNTSPLAIALSKVTNVFLPESMEASPVQADYAIKAYFGWLGATIAGTSHYAMMPFSKGAYPDHNWTETMSMGFIKTLPATQSGYVTSFYENMKLMSQAYADMRHYAEIGESEKVQKLLEEKGDQIGLAKFYDQTSKDMAKIRQVINFIQTDKTMTGSQKRQEIDRLKMLIGELAKQAEDVRKSMRK